MVSYLIAFIVHVVVTWAYSLNESSKSLGSGGRAGSDSGRRILVHGPFDEFGGEASAPSRMQQDAYGGWQYDLMAELPSEFQFSMWEHDAKIKLALMQTMQDVNNGTGLGSLLPTSNSRNIIHITKFPAPPNLAYRISIDGASLQYVLTPIGSRQNQAVAYFLLWTIPLLTGFASIWIYWYSFCAVKVYRFIKIRKCSLLPTTSSSKIRFHHWLSDTPLDLFAQGNFTCSGSLRKCLTQQTAVASGLRRRTILLATMEYEIGDWGIKISIGGLGFMAQLMSKSLEKQDLVWVVPCVQGIDYPHDQRAEPMNITISGVDHIVQVQYHSVENITYILLDAPVFRAQTVNEPYPRSTDDIGSAIYYSTWYVLFIFGKPSFPSLNRLCHLRR